MIDNIIFDLDGTLWQTRDSYLFAYKQACDIYKKNETIDYKEVLNFLGIKLDVLIDSLFSNVKNKEILEKETVYCATEYLKNNSTDCIYDGVTALLEKLSKHYNIFVVSNAPALFVETFLEISKCKKFIKKYYTIEDGTKTENLLKIKSDNKILFVGDAEDDYKSIVDHKKVIFCYAKYGYKQCSSYDYYIDAPLDLFGVLKDIEVNHKMINGFNYEIISSHDSKATVMYKIKYNYFGFVELTNTKDDLILVNKLKKINNLIGPFNGNTWYGYRYQINEFNFKLYPDCDNSEYELNLFLDNNFTVKQKYVSTLAYINYRIWNKAKKSRLKTGYSYKIYQGKECYDKIEEIYSIAIDAFSKADFYEYISKSEFIDIYLKNIELCNPDLVMIYYKTKPIAFNFCYEDLEKRFYVCKTTAIKKQYQHKNVLLKLIDYSYNLMTKKGYSEVLYHFSNDRTKVLNAIYRRNIIKQKYYAILKREND